MNFIFKQRTISLGSLFTILCAIAMSACSSVKSPLEGGNSPWSSGLQVAGEESDSSQKRSKKEKKVNLDQPRSKKASPWGKEKNPELAKLKRQLKAEKKLQKRLKRRQQEEEKQLRSERAAQKKIKSIETKIAQLKAEQEALGYTEPEKVTPRRTPKVTTSQPQPTFSKRDDQVIENDVFIASQKQSQSTSPTAPAVQKVTERESLFRRPDLTNNLPSEQKSQNNSSFKEAPVEEGIIISGDSSQ